MNRNIEYKLLKQDVLNGYNNMMHTIYKTHNKFSTKEIKLITMNILVQHITQKLMESERKRNRRIKKEVENKIKKQNIQVVFEEIFEEVK
jgi:hypothetical protein